MLFKSDNIVHFRAQGNDENGPDWKCLRYYFSNFVNLPLFILKVSSFSPEKAENENMKNKFSLLWGEAQLCLPYVCLQKKKL